MKLQKPESLRQQVYTHLKEQIISCQIADGEILNERRLSDVFGISRTPIREALKTLEHEGWVEYVPYKGAIVKKLQHNDIEDVFHIRNSLETLAVELAIERSSVAAVDVLSGILARQQELLVDKSKRTAEFIDLDRKFHNEIAQLTNSELLINMLKMISDKVKSLGVSALFSFEDRYQETTAEHAAILQAILARDSAMAKERMRYHLQQTYENANRYLQRI